MTGQEDPQNPSSGGVGGAGTPPPGGAPPPPPGYGAPPGGQPGYGGQPPAYGQQPPGYGGQPPGYGGPPPGYGGPPPGYGGPPPGYGPYGVVPPTLDSVFYKTGLNILLYIITCGIWGIVWTYRTHDDLQKHNGDGLGGAIGAILAVFVSPAVMFTIPSEIEKMYHRSGMQSPVKTIEGLWFLLPIIGQFIWYPKMQKALNDFWVMRGAQPAP